MGKDWSRPEVEAIVADYFAMLRDELLERPFNKTAHNRSLQKVLQERSKASIEFKHANISAVLDELGCPAIEGYKRRINYQELLREVVVERLMNDHALRELMEAVTSAPVVEKPRVTDWNSVIVPSPHREAPRRLGTGHAPATLHQGVDYLEREARNRSLGAAGEEFVLEVEHARLLSHGARRLARRIDHVSRTKGDGLGYDILSFEPNGARRFIEVKTTRFGSRTPFFVTSNEVKASDGNGERYHLYRVFTFNRDPRLFVLPGALRKTVVLHPATYRASLP